MPECDDLPDVAEYAVGAGDLVPAELYALPPKTLKLTLTGIPADAQNVFVILSEEPESND